MTFENKYKSTYERKHTHECSSIGIEPMRVSEQNCKSRKRERVQTSERAK